MAPNHKSGGSGPRFETCTSASTIRWQTVACVSGWYRPAIYCHLVDLFKLVDADVYQPYKAEEQKGKENNVIYILVHYNRI